MRTIYLGTNMLAAMKSPMSPRMSHMLCGTHCIQFTNGQTHEISNSPMARPMRCIHKPGVTVIPLCLHYLMGVCHASGILPCWPGLLLVLACSCSLQGNELPTFLLPYDSYTNDTACSLLVWCRLHLA